MNRPRVVFDTNVFILEMAKAGLKGSFVTADPSQLSSSNLVLDALNEAEHTLAISPQVLDEYWRLIAKLGGGACIVHIIVRRLSGLRLAGRLVRSNPKLEPRDLPDIEPKDRHVVQCAIGAKASIIVSRDGNHLVSRDAAQLLLARYGIGAMRPREYRQLCRQAVRTAQST